MPETVETFKVGMLIMCSLGFGFFIGMLATLAVTNKQEKEPPKELDKRWN